MICRKDTDKGSLFNYFFSFCENINSYVNNLQKWFCLGSNHYIINNYLCYKHSECRMLLALLVCVLKQKTKVQIMKKFGNKDVGKFRMRIKIRKEAKSIFSTWLTSGIWSTWNECDYSLRRKASMYVNLHRFRFMW